MGKLNRILPFALATLVLGIAIVLVPPSLHLAPVAHGSTRTVSLIGNYVYGWNWTQPSGTNPTITVNQGDTIKFQLTSVDTTHQFALDNDQDGPMFILSCPSGDTCSSTFTQTAPTSITILVSLGPGTYKYFCTFHSAMVGDFVVQAGPNFNVASNPSSLAIVRGSSSTSTITVSGQNRFNGTISLSATVSPSGLIESLKPTSVTISSGNSQTSILSVNSTSSTPAGSYTVTVIGNNGTITHTTTVSVTINAPDFSLSSNPTSLNVVQGSTGTTTITLTSVNGFSGTITLTGSVSPSGPTVSFSPASLTISGGSATSTLTISASSMGIYSTPVSNGNYSVNITATSGSLSHSTTVQVTVGSSSSSPSGLLPLSSTVLIGIVVIIVAAVAVTVYLVRRKPK